MFDINRIVVLILIVALLYALYMYQQQLPLPFINNKNSNIQDKKTIKHSSESGDQDNRIDSDEPNEPNEPRNNYRVKKSKSRSRSRSQRVNANKEHSGLQRRSQDKSSSTNSRSRNRSSRSHSRHRNDNTDLISIDNISQVSLGSLLDVDSRQGGVYKKASELNSLDSGGTFGSLLNEDTEREGDRGEREGGRENENFFFQ